MAPPKALTLVAEAFVQPDRGLVVWKDVQLELRDAHLARPRLDGRHEGATDAPPPARSRHHEPDVGDVRAGGMRVARGRQTSDEAAVLLGDDDGRVDVTPDGPQIAALVGGAAPAAVRDEPPFGFGADVAGKLDEGGGVAGLSFTKSYTHHRT